MIKWLRKILVAALALSISFLLYVEIINWNSSKMTYRQKILKAIYPAFMWLTRVTGKNTTGLAQKAEPKISFHSLQAVLNNGDPIRFETLKGKKVLLVNTASNCGYTNQYDDLQKLASQYSDKLVVIGFPANDFKQQEKGSDDEIAQFCKANYGVTFPLIRKSKVVNGADQHPIFQWLTQPEQNGWNAKQPTWNFSKYLVNENGALTNYFDPSISPMSNEIIKAIQQKP